MGCASSKLDDLPAVALCRDRCNFLHEAIQQRYALAEAHVAYMQSLKSIGLSLHHFFDQDLDVLSMSKTPLSPVLPLPKERKGDLNHKFVAAAAEASGSPEATGLPHHLHSNSGSHLQFQSDSDDDEGSSGSLHHSGNSSPLHAHNHGEYGIDDHETLGSYPGGFMNMNYMKNQPTPSVSVEQRPVSSQTVHMNYMKNQATPSVSVELRPVSSQTVHMNYMKNQATPSVSVEQRPVSSQTVHMNYMKNQATPSVSVEQRPVSSQTVQMNYMKNQATPSMSYEQRPMSPPTMHMGESSYYPYNTSNDNYGSYGGQYYGYPNYGGGSNGYFGGPPPYGGAPPSQQAVASSSKPPPPMPSPERSSAWDIFNPFEYDKYYSPYTPSRDSKEVREEEGIPDLEDEDYYQHEVVKEVHGAQRFADGGGGGGTYSKSVVNDEDRKVNDNEALYKTRPSVSVENEGMEYDVHMVDKKVVGNEKSEERSKAGAFKGRGAFQGVSEVVREILLQFERASESGNELAKILEVGKLQYHRKHGANLVSSKMLHVITPSMSVVSSQPSTSTNAESSSSAPNTGSALMGFEEEAGIKLKNLSSTLHKLYLWEKKLYNEVKAEEKMRIIHDRKCRKLKRLDEKGAEAHKVDTTRTLIRSLSTKIKIAIQVVDKISVTINTIRDEELWPQLNELIQGLTRMWKSMLECHRSQCQAIKEAKSLDAIASHKKPGDAQLEATLQLEHELISWTLRFSSWVGTQKGYIRALNSWLLKCLLYEPEETPDGIAPFSPGRIGAPTVFVICNQWAQALDRISEKEVIDSMRVFANTVLQFWERDKVLLRQSMVANKDLERKVKLLDREDHKIQKEIQALDKRMIMVSGDGNSLLLSDQSVYQSDTSSVNSLQGSLQHIFEAMERFTASSTKAYEELLQRSEEDRLSREKARVA